MYVSDVVRERKPKRSGNREVKRNARISNGYRFVSHYSPLSFSVSVSYPSAVHVHLDPSNSFAAAVGIRSVHASNSISYTTNVMPLTGNARAHNSQNPRKNRAAPPSRYVLIAQSHVPRYVGSAARLSTITFDLITSNGNTDIQLATPASHVGLTGRRAHSVPGNPMAINLTRPRDRYGQSTKKPEDLFVRTYRRTRARPGLAQRISIFVEKNSPI